MRGVSVAQETTQTNVFDYMLKKIADAAGDDALLAIDVLVAAMYTFSQQEIKHAIDTLECMRKKTIYNALVELSKIRAETIAAKERQQTLAMVIVDAINRVFKLEELRAIMYTYKQLSNIKTTLASYSIEDAKKRIREELKYLSMLYNIKITPGGGCDE